MLIRPAFFSGQLKKPANQTTKGAAEFLRSHDRLAALMPGVMRLIELQKDCAAALPEIFGMGHVLQFSADQLLVAVPNAACATRLKQQLPKLQTTLVKRGWQVNAIRIKVQVTKIPEKSKTSDKVALSDQAIDAFAELDRALEHSPRNQGLKQALQAITRHQRRK